MMNRLESAARQALEALDQIATHVGQYDLPGMPNHITTLATLHRDALREALAAQQAAEPVARCMAHGECFGGECIYPAPTQQPLTDEQKAVLRECRNQAMKWAAQAKIPECAAFGEVAQDLDWLCGQLGIAGNQKGGAA